MKFFITLLKINETNADNLDKINESNTTNLGIIRQDVENLVKKLLHQRESVPTTRKKSKSTKAKKLLRDVVSTVSAVSSKSNKRDHDGDQEHNRAMADETKADKTHTDDSKEEVVDA